jgi:hypothetical protein
MQVTCITNKCDRFSPSNNSQQASIYIGYLDLQLSSGLERQIQKGSSPEEIEELGCNDWVLSESDLTNLLTSMRIATSEEYNSLCYFYPCFYTCTVTNDSLSYTMMINAASWVCLYNDTVKVYFINSAKSNVFIQACDCCE